MVFLIVYCWTYLCRYIYNLLAEHLAAVVLQNHLSTHANPVSGKGAAVAYACAVVNLVVCAIKWVAGVEIVGISKTVKAKCVVERRERTADIEIVVYIDSPTTYANI